MWYFIEQDGSYLFQTAKIYSAHRESWDAEFGINIGPLHYSLKHKFNY